MSGIIEPVATTRGSNKQSKHQREQDQALAAELIERARAEGVGLLGPGGLLTGLTKTVLETALEAELTDHLGYDKHPASRVISFQMTRPRPASFGGHQRGGADTPDARHLPGPGEPTDAVLIWTRRDLPGQIVGVTTAHSVVRLRTGPDR